MCIGASIEGNLNSASGSADARFQNSNTIPKNWNLFQKIGIPSYSAQIPVKFQFVPQNWNRVSPWFIRQKHHFWAKNSKIPIYFQDMSVLEVLCSFDSFSECKFSQRITLLSDKMDAKTSRFPKQSNSKNTGILELTTIYSTKYFFFYIIQPHFPSHFPNKVIPND